MGFQGFSESDFSVFKIEGFEERMEAIRKQIQPKFHELGSVLTDMVSVEVGNEMYLHVAKHARRKVNPPNDTWLAISPNKRGYKSHPHFQVGLFDDHLFIWLAYIYEFPNKKELAENFLKHLDSIIDLLPNDFVLSTDHMKKDALPVKKDELEKALIRLKQVKKAELLIGKHIPSTNPILRDGKALTELIFATIKGLIPIYNGTFAKVHT
ncbi:YktB family protein [Fervidibacillus halotolerans]|uniref:UPF0637 protein OE105_03730 n=1 Tax=Fervidibacillus halotolerans TaxID=2980027 RepID=A0A9E8RZK7_9BACI|nr:DUF1054 domain-containing protein [Fervidibacillus halotolerans]WAA13244.1 DUF1054 domain-containing protein [Fervidibacillus halotolerans]